MKNYACLVIPLVSLSAALAVGVMLGRASTAPRPDPPRASAPDRADATTMRPAVKIDTSGKKLKVHGVITVHRPFGLGKDHKVDVMLTVTRPDGTDARPPVKLAEFDYPKDQVPLKAHAIDKDLDVDATGCDVKVAAVDRDTPTREFASITVHGAGAPKP